jgi:hypothetical protein
MSLVWTNYSTDTGFNYPFIPVSIERISELEREESPMLALPTTEIAIGGYLGQLLPQGTKL